MLVDPIAAALFSKAQSEILGLLFSHPDESFYLREIAHRTALAAGHVQRQLATLVHAGIVQRSNVGRHVYFKADPACPVYQELRSIITKTVAAVTILRQAFLPFSGKINVAFIFGSVARHEENKASDLDLLVIGSVGLGELVTALQHAQHTLAREINPIVYPLDEFRDKLSRSHHFLTRVVNSPKLFVIGGEHELASLSAKRMDQTA
jgi:predicted nucleotidyltransferase